MDIAHNSSWCSHLSIWNLAHVAWGKHCEVHGKEQALVKKCHLQIKALLFTNPTGQVHAPACVYSYYLFFHVCIHSIDVTEFLTLHKQ